MSASSSSSAVPSTLSLDTVEIACRSADCHWTHTIAEGALLDFAPMRRHQQQCAHIRARVQVQLLRLQQAAAEAARVALESQRQAAEMEQRLRRMTEPSLPGEVTDAMEDEQGDQDLASVAPNSATASASPTSALAAAAAPPTLAVASSPAVIAAVVSQPASHKRASRVFKRHACVGSARSRVYESQRRGV